MAAGFTTREVAELADVPVRAVDKAVEEKAFAALAGNVSARRRLFPLHAIAYTATIARLPVTLSLSTKRNLAKMLAKRPVATMTSEVLHLAPAVTIDLGALVGRDLAERAERYSRGRENLIEINPDIMGGTPVIRGTRITVYSILGRLSGSDTIEDILEDYPNLSRDAVETAALYARTHPPLGRPGGRPWAQSA